MVGPAMAGYSIETNVVASLVVQLTKSTGCGANLRREVRGDVDPSPWEAARERQPVLWSAVVGVAPFHGCVGCT